MALKRTSIAETKPTAVKDARPAFVLPAGDDPMSPVCLVEEYNLAVEKEKYYTAKKETTRGKILEQGLEYYYQYNIAHPTAPATSIDLADISGASLILTSQDKYSAVNPDSAEALFTKLQADVNAYVEEKVIASFDQKVFENAAGNFSEEIYAAYAAAIEKTTRDLVTKGVLKKGTPSPLQSTKKVLPKANFNSARYADFPTVQAQLHIREVLSNTITLKPTSAAQLS